MFPYVFIYFSKYLLKFNGYSTIGHQLFLFVTNFWKPINNDRAINRPNRDTPWRVETMTHGQTRDEKRNLRFPCIQWKREQNFVPVSTVYKGNANFVFHPWDKQSADNSVFCNTIN
jgi:hypothetical protein